MCQQQGILLKTVRGSLGAHLAAKHHHSSVDQRILYSGELTPIDLPEMAYVGWRWLAGCRYLADNIDSVVVMLDAENTYRLTITAPGFSEWDSPDIALLPGQNLDLDDIEMKISEVETTVSAVFAERV